MLCPSWGESLDQAARPSPRARRFLFGSGPVIGGAGAVAISTPLSGSSCSGRASPPSPGRRRAAYRAPPCPMGAVSSEPLAARLTGRLVKRHEGGEARVEVVGKPRGRAAPARRIAPLEEPPEFLPPLPAPNARSREARPATAPCRSKGRGGPSCGDGVMRYRSRAGYRCRGSVRARHIAASPGLEPCQARRFHAPFLWV